MPSVKCKTCAVLIAAAFACVCPAAAPSDVVVERYTQETIGDCTHILFHGKLELITVDNRFLVRSSHTEAWQASPLTDFQDAHSVAWHPRLQLYFATNTANGRMFSFRDPMIDKKEKSVETIAGVKLDRPHDVVVDDDGWIYVINPNHATTVVRFRDLGIDETSLDLSEHLTYSRALSIVRNRLYVVGSSVGKVVEVTDFNGKQFKVYESHGKKKDSPAGSWTTTGLVPNDADMFDGWWYMTSYFCPEYARDTDCNEHKLIRFQTWDDFRTGQWEDLSKLLPDKIVPYYLTPHGESLYIAAFIHEDPQHPGGVWRLK